MGNIQKIIGYEPYHTPGTDSPYLLLMNEDIQSENQVCVV